MPTAAACPNDDLLARGARGDLPPEEAERLALHLEQCSTCARRMDGLADENHLGQALRAGRHLAAPAEDAQLVAVMDQLLRLPAAAAKPGATAVFDHAGQETPRAGLTMDETDEDLHGLLSPAEQPDEIGRLGPYRVIGLLGKGGMGLVFRAEDSALKRPVALKVMRPELCRTRSARDRFMREAQAAAALRHDHVVPIYQVGEVNGTPFLVMPLLDGMSLEERLRNAEKLPVLLSVRLAQQIALGLAAAHERGLVHRDIKPANLWLENSREPRVESTEPEGPERPPETSALAPGLSALDSFRVMILDFGLARPVEGEADLTASGLILGTPAYMAPEQARGEKVDLRCDLFSFGCVLYRMSTGALPFPGKSMSEVLVALATAVPALPETLNPKILPALSALIMELLAKDPAQRPASARAVAQRLHGLERDMLAAPALRTQPDAPPMKPANLSSPRRRWLLGAAGLLALVGGALAAFQLAYSTAEGTLLVKIDDPNVEARFKNGVLHLHDRDGKLLYKLQPAQRDKQLPAGQYLISVAGADGLTLDTKEFTLKSGDKRTVRVVLVPPDVAKCDPPEPRPALPAGTPLSPLALVMQPAGLPGVQGWTIETAVHRGGIWDLAFSPDGKWLATVGQDSTLRMSDAATGVVKSVLIMPIRVPGGRLLAWAPDSQRIIVNTHPEISVWDVLAGRKLADLAALPDPSSVAWSPDGKWIALNQNPPTGNGSMLVLAADTGTKVDTWLTHPYSVNCFSPDGRTLAYLAPDGKSIKFLDCMSFKPLHALSLSKEIGANPPYVRYQWSPDGKMFAVQLLARGDVHVYDSKDYQHLASFDGKVHNPGAHSPSYRGGLTWLADSQTLACVYLEASQLPRVAFVEARTGKLLRKLPAAPFIYDSSARLACSPDGKTLALGCTFQGSLVLFDVAEGQPRKIILGQFLRGATSIHWSPDGKKLRLDLGDNPISSQDTVREIASALPELSRAAQPEFLKLHLSPDGTMWVDWTNSAQTHVTLSNSATGKTLKLDQPAGFNRRNFAWSADSKWLATGNHNTDMRVWEAATGKLVQKFTPGGNGYSVPAFDPHKKTLALGAVFHSGTIAFFDTVSGKQEYQVTASTSEIYSLAFAPDGKTLAAGFQRNGTVKLLSADGRKELRVIPAHPPGVTVLSWSPDSRVLASNCKADVVRLWDAATGQPVAAVVPLEDGIVLTVSAGGHYRGVPRSMEQSLVYVVQTAQGQETLTPAAFAKKYGWKNDPGRVKLSTGEGI